MTFAPIQDRKGWQEVKRKQSAGYRPKPKSDLQTQQAQEKKQNEQQFRYRYGNHQ